MGLGRLSATAYPDLRRRGVPRRPSAVPVNANRRGIDHAQANLARRVIVISAIITIAVGNWVAPVPPHRSRRAR